MPELPNLPPISAAPLSVVLLARDDAAGVESVLEEWLSFLSGLEREFELILVEDGSAGHIAGLAERYPAVRVLGHDRARGEGFALTAGLAAAKHPLVAYCRCEPRYRPDELTKLLREIDKVHLVSGYRAGRKTPFGVRLARLLSRVFQTVVFSHMPARSPGWLGWKHQFGRWFVRACFGVRSKDVACPFRLFRREILGRIRLQSRGSFAHVELLAKANFLGYLIAEEVPLGDRHDPMPPEHSRHERLREIVADARLVFSRPDFGPVHLDEPAAPAATSLDG